MPQTPGEMNCSHSPSRQQATSFSPLPPASIDGHTQEAAQKQEQQETQEVLEPGEREFRTLAESIPQLVWVTRPDGYKEYFNQQWYEYTGMTREQMQEIDWFHFLHPDDYPSMMKIWEHSRDTGEPFQIEYRIREGKTGAYRWFIGRALPVRSSDGMILRWFGTCTDIDDFKKSQQALEQTTAFLRGIIEGTSNPITIKDRSGRYQLVNPSAAEVFGKPVAEILGRDDTAFFPPEIAQTLIETDQRIMTTGNAETLEERLLVNGEEKIFLSTKSPLRDANNEITGLILVTRDITDRKEVEQRKDDFISMASHELKTPITTLKAQTQLLKRRLEREGHNDAVTALAKIETQTNRLTRLVSDLLDVAKIQSGQLDYAEEAIAIDDLVRESIETVRHTTSTHTITLHGASSRQVIGDKDRLEQVFINMLNNAIKYSPQATNVDVFLDTTDTTMTIRVQDYGIGISEANRDKIFERFYRVLDGNTKTLSGLGMGLFISNEIVQRHHGNIDVTGEEGTGTTFSVTLPTR
jgi:PAS domain S-box-containing protein